LIIHDATLLPVKVAGAGVELGQCQREAPLREI
jgi:hypothetical protein